MTVTEAGGDVVPMDLSMLGKDKGKKGKGDKKGNGKVKGRKSESSKDEKGKDEDKKGKGNCKANAKTTKHFAGYCFLCKAWGHAKKACWWNESAKSGKDTASLVTPITPAANTATKPPITGMKLCQATLHSGCTP